MMGEGPRSLTVAVTGIGVVSPIGVGREAFWTALCAGDSAIAPIAKFRVDAGSPRLGAEIRDFDARRFIASSHLRRMDFVSRIIASAARMALDDGGLRMSDVQPDRVGVMIGTAFGDISESALHLEKVFTRGPSAASPMMFPNLVMNAAAGYVAMDLGITGANLTVSQGETSGDQAIVAGCDLIRSGRADFILAGGGDELAGIVHTVYRRARALSSQRGGEEWCSPYDANRNGVILGEGAAVLLLESPEQARRRGAAVYAEIVADAVFGVPSPPYDWPRDASGATGRLTRLWQSAEPRGSGLICASGNSSRDLDAFERDLFDGASVAAGADMALTSIKGAVGEFGAAGALTIATAALALREQVVPPLAHLRTPDRSVAPPLAGPRAEPQRLEQALVCGVGRGGAVVCLLLRR